MDKNSSYKIINDTLAGPFSKEHFLLFVKNLLNEIDEEKAFHARGYVPEVFKNYVKTYERLGTYTDPEGKKIDVLIVYLQKESSLERARTAQRNFVARYLKDRDQKDGGLVAFVSPNSEDWRFSFIKMEYKFTEGKSGKIKVKEEFTPARRWSFLVGVNESSHTAQSRLAPIVQEDEHNPTFKILEDAFSIEKVTEEFFEKYRDLFLRVKEILDDLVKKDSTLRKDFTEKSVNTVDFAKKLLGQIVFLYFLQKKGWFGVERDTSWGSGPKNFLRQLHEKKHGNYKNFFNDILEPLFYEALRVDRSHDDNYYSRFNCKIPFLNGGLFDPINNYDWVHTDINLPNDIFSNDRPTKEGDAGDGILDIFDRYNFTVKEDEPLEKEVAVDPEMLGKVFENLLEVKDRKSKGTYYTPREIVHYMCVQSLANYLTAELDNKVSKDDLEQLIKYGDAVGENEARVEEKGEETQRYHYKLPESIRIHAKAIDQKLANIKVCDPAIGSGAFPVGMMTEIVRTRMTLSSYIKDTSRTLYNFKRDCIQNSLYGVDIDPGAVEIAKLRLWLSLVVDEDDIEQIKPLPNLDYKIVCGNSLTGVEKNLFNQDLFSELEKLKPLLFNETNPKRKLEYKKKIDDLIKRITNDNRNFDFEVYFSEVYHHKKGFDVVIANPPYGANIDSMVAIYAKLYPNTTKSFKDIYKIFIEMGLAKLVKKRGVLCYIVPNTLLLQPRYKDARKFLLNWNILEILNLGEQVFEQVVVPTCVIFVQSESNEQNMIRYGDLSKESKFNGDMDNIVHDNVAQKEYLSEPDYIFALKFRSLMKDEMVLDEILDMKDCGIKYQRVGVGLAQKGNNDLAERIFYDAPRKNGKDRQVIIGKNLHSGGWYIDLTPKKFMRHDYRKLLKKNEIVYFNSDFFDAPQKIVWRQTSPYFIGALLEEPLWFANTLQVGILKNGSEKVFDLKYVLALLNSKYLRYLYSLAVRELGRVFPQVKLVKLKNLPIKKISPEEQKPFIEIVDKISAITKSPDYLANTNKQNRVHDYQNQIDQLVFELYSVSSVDIKNAEESLR